MATIRIDTIRNRIAGTRELLALIYEEIQDLHLLAYERATAVSEAKVSGGSHDYALDTHGDRDARDAYRHLGDTLDRMCGQLDDAVTQALNVLRKGDSPTRGARHLRVVELGEAITAQARRSRRGDYTPIRRGPQPDMTNVLEQMQEERDRAIRERDRAVKERNQAVTDLRNQRDRHRPSTS